MRTRLGLTVLALLLLPLGACTPTPPARLYTLAPAEAAPIEAGTGAVVGLGPVELPSYLDRPEIVTREGPHEVAIGEFDRWAEPLQPMVVRLLADRLRQATGSREVVPLPARWSAEPRHAVAVLVDRFDADETGQVVLDTRWRYYQTSDGRSLRGGHEMIALPTGPASPPGVGYASKEPRRDYAALVATMARAVGELARRIAAGLPNARATPARS